MIRRLRFAAERRPASRSSTPSARATTSCWSGRSRTSRSASGCASRASGRTTSASGCRSRCALAESVAAVGRGGAARVPASASSTSAARARRELLDTTASDVLEAIDDDPGARLPPARAEPAARQRGDPSPGTSCAPRARCTCCSRRTGWRGSCRGSPTEYGDRAHEVVRKRPVRAHERVRRRLPRSRTRSRAPPASRPTAPGRAPRGGRARAERGRARRLDVPAGRRAGGAARRSCSAARRPTRRCCRTWPTARQIVLERDDDGACGPTGRVTAALEEELAVDDPRAAEAARRP